MHTSVETGTGGGASGPEAEEPRSPVGPRWLRRHAGIGLLAATILLPLAIAGAGAWSAWGESWQTAERELARTADATAEYAERVLGAHRLGAELVNHMLAGLSDAAIRDREAELHERLAALVPLLPMTNTIAVLDREARVLVTANVFPVPQVAVPDREWVVALRRPDAPAVHISGITTGRIDTNFFFGVSIRRRDTGNGLPAGAFDGVVNISVNPLQVGTGLEAITRAQMDVLSLVRADGEVLARHPVFNVRLAPIPVDSPLRAAAASGQRRGSYMGRSFLGLPPHTHRGEHLLVAYRRIGELPVYAAASRPRGAIVARWRAEALEQFGIAVPAALALFALGLLVLRGQRRLALSEADFRAAFERSAIGMVQADPATGRFLRVNGRFCGMVGRTRRELLSGITFPDITHPEDRAANAEGFVAAMAAHHEYVVEKRLLRPDGAAVWVRVHVALIRGSGGRPLRTIAAVQDITERRAAEERQLLLAREVDHRAKNALAVVQSIVKLSRAEDPRSFAETVQGRIAALSRAHALLADSRWTGAELRSLVAEEAAAFLGRNGAGEARLAMAGPPLTVVPNAAQPLAMAIHELATNAAKYGALSAPEGKVLVRWRRDPAHGGIELVWEERGGPPVSPPQRRGFGAAVLEATVMRQLGGTLDLAWESAGLRCTIRLPASQVRQAGAVREA